MPFKRFSAALVAPGIFSDDEIYGELEALLFDMS